MILVIVVWFVVTYSLYIWFYWFDGMHSAWFNSDKSRVWTYIHVTLSFCARIDYYTHRKYYDKIFERAAAEAKKEDKK